MATFSQRLAKYERQRSLPADWSQKLAVFAACFLAIVIVGHRFDTISTIPTFWLLGVGLAMVLAAIALGLRGLFDLWERGEEGGLKAARGLLLASLLIAPFFYTGLKAFTLPPLNDVSTDLDDPPQFENAVYDRTEAMNDITDPTDVTRRLQLKAYPRVVARRYPLGAGRVFSAVAELVRDRDWTILTSATSTGEAPIDDEGSALVAKPTSDANGLPLRVATPNFRPPEIRDEPTTAIEAQSVSPIGRNDADSEEEPLEERYVEAVSSSLIFGFQTDVVFRIVEEEEGTLVDMRSASRWGPHDLGANAQQIISFMEDLDTALQGLSQ
ncbi:DUF1499 domain-containing protein [Pseudahrensia aquimaris]|uniref:DUF1499 domain-containing protein n=1 Tax=Pseudahrensia aquimaris TaxID=744461 RepID=A0ABW3FDW3_9HYPH